MRTATDCVFHSAASALGPGLSPGASSDASDCAPSPPPPLPPLTPMPSVSPSPPPAPPPTPVIDLTFQSAPLVAARRDMSWMEVILNPAALTSAPPPADKSDPARRRSV
ncbi:hypothetical protein C8Q77DRAFT_1155036 [Trametes polyzona]|nr:hypothetical protein C8Q77DRAFT_1155036 [Trametes polyzona]